MQFFNDGSGPSDVEWYFVDDDTPFIQFPTAFRSLNWDGDRLGPSDTLGEVYGADRPYSNGVRVGDADPAGGPCGTFDEWHNGQAAPPVPPVVLDLFGSPECCTPLGGPFVGSFCQLCPDGAWNEYHLSVSLFAGNWIHANGTWTLRYVGDCTWESEDFALLTPPPASARWRLEKVAVYQWRLIFHSEGSSFLFWWPIGDWDCLSTARADLLITGSPSLFVGLVTPLYLVPPA
jgi:hypothetical protein